MPVVGVGGGPSPIYERVRPCERKVDTRGVENEGKGICPLIVEVNVIVDGVRVVSVGEGGKTNKVCEGVEATEEESTETFRRCIFRKCSGGGTNFRDSARRRTGGDTMGLP